MCPKGGPAQVAPTSLTTNTISPLLGTFGKQDYFFKCQVNTWVWSILKIDAEGPFLKYPISKQYQTLKSNIATYFRIEIPRYLVDKRTLCISNFSEWRLFYLWEAQVLFSWAHDIERRPWNRKRTWGRRSPQECPLLQLPWEWRSWMHQKQRKLLHAHRTGDGASSADHGTERHASLSRICRTTLSHPLSLGKRATSHLIWFRSENHPNIPRNPGLRISTNVCGWSQCEQRWPNSL